MYKVFQIYSVCLQNDDVQNFDAKWFQALSQASETPAETVLEGSYKSKSQDSVQRQTVLAKYEQENVRNNEPPNYSRLKTIIIRHIDQTMRTHNFQSLKRKSGKRSSIQESKKEKNLRESGRMLSVESSWIVFDRGLK